MGWDGRRGRVGSITLVGVACEGGGGGGLDLL